MQKCIRKNVDVSAGHCYNPRPADSGSNNVFINNLASVRVGDHYPIHTCGSSSHDGIAAKGSLTVFVNNKPIHRNSDTISCGDTASNGSQNVFAGD